MTIFRVHYFKYTIISLLTQLNFEVNYVILIFYGFDYKYHFADNRLLRSNVGSQLLRYLKLQLESIWRT